MRVIKDWIGDIYTKHGIYAALLAIAVLAIVVGLGIWLIGLDQVGLWLMQLG